MKITLTGFSLFTALIFTACGPDATGPGMPPQLSLAEYASQLAGDPFLLSVATSIGKPELAARIDRAARRIQQPPNGAATLTLPIAADVSTPTTSSDTTGTITESDVLAAVLTVTLERLDEVAAGGTSSPDSSPPSAPDPPPTR